jgi:hypothetical protein
MAPRSELPRQSTLPVALALIATSFSDQSRIRVVRGRRRHPERHRRRLVSPFVDSERARARRNASRGGVTLHQRRPTRRISRHPQEVPQAGVISSDIALAQAATGGNQTNGATDAGPQASH